MRLKTWFGPVLIILLTVSTVGLRGCIEKEQEPVKVGVVFEACGLDDAFNKLCFAGAERAEDELGISAEYVVVMK